MYFRHTHPHSLISDTPILTHSSQTHPSSLTHLRHTHPHSLISDTPILTHSSQTHPSSLTHLRHTHPHSLISDTPIITHLSQTHPSSLTHHRHTHLHSLISDTPIITHSSQTHPSSVTLDLFRLFNFKDEPQCCDRKPYQSRGRINFKGNLLFTHFNEIQPPRPNEDLQLETIRR